MKQDEKKSSDENVNEKNKKIIEDAQRKIKKIVSIPGLDLKLIVMMRMTGSRSLRGSGIRHR